MYATRKSSLIAAALLVAASVFAVTIVVVVERPRGDGRWISPHTNSWEMAHFFNPTNAADPVITDQSGHNRPGTIGLGGATEPARSQVSGDVYQYDFDGINDYYVASDDPYDPVFDPWSVTLWCKYSGNEGADTFLLSIRGTTQPSVIHIIRKANEKISCLTDDSGGARLSAVSPVAYNDGQWHFVAATRLANTIVLYVDGIQVDSDTGSYNRTRLTAGFNTGFHIGVFAIPLTSHYDGAINRVIFYSKTISSNEQYAIWQNTNPTSSNEDYFWLP